jgi:hypothetical protein
MKKIVYKIHNNEACFLIPKERGAGFNSQPLGEGGTNFERFISDTLKLEYRVDEGFLRVWGKDIATVPDLIGKFLNHPIEQVQAKQFAKIVGGMTMRIDDWYVIIDGVVCFDPVKNFNIHVGMNLPNDFRESAPPKATKYFEDKRKPRFIRPKDETINPATVTNEMNA